MKLRVRRSFKYMVDNVTAHQRQLKPGNYEVPDDVAESTALLAIQFGAAVWVYPAVEKIPFKKVAPENKMVQVPENKVDKPKKPRKVSKKRVSRKK